MYFKIFKIKNIMNKLTVDKNIVKEVAELLININGETTTKEIKTELRDNNYYATQEIVSNFMAQISNEQGWSYTFNGEYRTYFIDKDVTDTTDDEEVIEEDEDGGITNDGNISASTNTNVITPDVHEPYVNQFHLMKDGFIVKPIQPATSIPIGSWKVFNPNNTNQYIYLDGSLSREQVRYAFYKIYNLPKGSFYSAHKV